MGPQLCYDITPYVTDLRQFYICDLSVFKVISGSINSNSQSYYCRPMKNVPISQSKVNFFCVADILAE